LTGASILLAAEVAADARPSAGRALEVGVTKNLSLTGTDASGLLCRAELLTWGY